MKKVMALLVVAALVVGGMLTFASSGVYAADDGKKASLFQKWADYIGTPIEMEVKPLKTIGVFQHMSDGIEEGSQKAKQESLRTPKACK